MCCSVTHPFKCSGQLLWQPAQTGDEIRAGAVALRESLSICLLTPPFSLCIEEAAREAAHKQQRWLTPAPSPRADHHHAELTAPPITAESDGDEGDNVEKSEPFSVLSVFFGLEFKVAFTPQKWLLTLYYNTQIHQHAFFFFFFKDQKTE